MFPSHTDHTTQQLYIGEDVNIILSKFSTSHLQNSVMLIAELELLKDDEDYWWDLDDYEEVQSFVTLPTVFTLTIVMLAVALRCWYLKKAKRVVKTLDLVCEKVSSITQPSRPVLLWTTHLHRHKPLFNCVCQLFFSILCLPRHSSYMLYLYTSTVGYSNYFIESMSNSIYSIVMYSIIIYIQLLYIHI